MSWLSLAVLLSYCTLASGFSVTLTSLPKNRLNSLEFKARETGFPAAIRQPQWTCKIGGSDRSSSGKKERSITGLGLRKKLAAVFLASVPLMGSPRIVVRHPLNGTNQMSRIFLVRPFCLWFNQFPCKDVFVQFSMQDFL
jgi:hypothetical protein